VALTATTIAVSLVATVLVALHAKLKPDELIQVLVD